MESLILNCGVAAVEPAEAARQAVEALGAAALQQAVAYTTGSEWIAVWGLVVAWLVAWLLVRSRLLDRLEARWARRSFFGRTYGVCAVFIVVSTLLTLPWSVYTEWWRETQYGRTSQPLGDYLLQTGIALLLATVFLGLFLTGMYGLLRRTRERWWLWSGGLAALGLVVVLLLSPLLIEPLFNDYQPLGAGPVRQALEQQAAAAGIPADRIFVYDGSRQSNNFTANVAGLGPWARIAISDVALRGASLDEVRAVTGHEIGHYVLGHVWRMVGVLSLLAFAAFYTVHRWYAPVARRLGTAAALASPAGLPVLALLGSALLLVAQPVTNGLVRWGETEADQYSLRTVNLPDAMVAALLKTAVYRNPRPGAVEEFCFYSHPAVERRVRMALQWQADHPVGRAP